MPEFQIHKLDFGNEIQYFIPYGAGTSGVTRRGLVFAKVGFDNKQPFISFDVEYRQKFIGGVPVVATVSTGELVDFLISKATAKEAQNAVRQ